MIPLRTVPMQFGPQSLPLGSAKTEARKHAVVRELGPSTAIQGLSPQLEGVALVEMGFGPSNTATTLQGTRSRVSDSGSRSRRSRPWVNERAFGACAPAT